MALPPDFIFSQSSLEDYSACPRRFQLRYVDRLAWPAPVTEPALEYEAHLRRGEQFHRLVQQHLIGVPVAALTAHVEADPHLYHWWDNYLKHAPVHHLEGARYAEIGLLAHLDDSALRAQYDLIIARPGESLTIIDWKTAQKPPPRETLARRWQTRVYRWVLAAAGAALNDGAPVDPAQIEMIYWFPGAPDQAEHFSYDDALFAADRAALADCIAEIQVRAAFERTEQVKRCDYCNYRSLCDRGTEAGPFEDIEGDGEDDLAEFTIRLDQIGEIAF